MARNTSREGEARLLEGAAIVTTSTTRQQLVYYLSECIITDMIVLASNSWLRKTIMDASGLQFITDNVELDERALEQKNQDKTDQEIAIILASAKAELIQHKHPDAVVIAADTFALLPSGERLHKPATPEEAVELCLVQSGKTIKAITGMAMAYK